VPAPFSNHCDMMYLSSALKAGPYLRTVLAHEYTHAVTNSVRASRVPATGPGGADEEDWLDEGLAHLGEDLHGFSRANLDYRVSAFLANPERYRLVVQDYYAAVLFRSHGNRGGTYLFLRWCADRYGPELLPALIHSNLRGTANLEAATGTSFAALYREWSLAIFQSGLEPVRSAGVGFPSRDARSAAGEWQGAGPRMHPVAPGDGGASWSPVGTSSRYMLIDGAPEGAVDVEIAGPEEADLQITAIPLPRGLARMERPVNRHRTR
jgi:hypothetical protein